MTFDGLLELFRSFGETPALDGARGHATYAELADRIEAVRDLPRPGTVVFLEGDFGPESVARLIALWRNGNIVVPTARCAGPSRAREIADVDSSLYEILRTRQAPGLVLLTSGTTGDPKGVVHDASVMLTKIARPGRTHRTLAFLGFDHIGGINTLLYGLTHGGCLVTPPDRAPSGVLSTIDRYHVELLPTTPSFLRLCLVDGAFAEYTLTSLQLITYGSEPMPESTLAALNHAIPAVPKLQQFGMSELGVLRSRSRESDSTWMRLGGPEFEIRIVDGRLEVKAETAMLGYLNAPSPFTEDGWLRTGDLAEQDGEWIRILGRASEVVNVGGEKVHPATVESVVEAMPNVAFAVVHGEPNPILGQTVAVKIRLVEDEALESFRRRLRLHCAERLPRYAIPTRIELTQDAPVGKKRRAA